MSARIYLNKAVERYIHELHTGEVLVDAICNTCQQQRQCEERGEEFGLSWMYHDQFVHCHEVVGKPAFITTENFIELEREVQTWESI